MPFIIENEKQNRMSFLDVRIIREDKTFTTFVDHKPNFSRINTHFDSFLSTNYKFRIVYTLAYRRFQKCSSWTKLHSEVIFFLKQIFLKNGDPENVINRSFKRIMDNIPVVNETTLTVERKPFVLVLP